MSSGSLVHIEFFCSSSKCNLKDLSTKKDAHLFRVDDECGKDEATRRTTAS